MLLLCIALWWTEEVELPLDNRTPSRPIRRAVQEQNQRIGYDSSEDNDDWDAAPPGFNTNEYGEYHENKLNHPSLPKILRATAGDQYDGDDESDVSDDDNEINDGDYDDDGEGDGGQSLTPESIHDLVITLFSKSSKHGPSNHSAIRISQNEVASIRVDDPKSVSACVLRPNGNRDCFDVELLKEVDQLQYWRLSKPFDTKPVIPPKGRLLNFNEKRCKSNENNVLMTRNPMVKGGYKFQCSPACNDGEVITCGKKPIGLWFRKRNSVGDSEEQEGGEFGEILDLAELLAMMRIGVVKPTAEPMKPPPALPKRQEEVPKKSNDDEGEKVRASDDSSDADRIVFFSMLLPVIAVCLCKLFSR
ncbi:hypothetical protein Trydic_g9261 [Trypoxylus dichotomus]